MRNLRVLLGMIWLGFAGFGCAAESVDDLPAVEDSVTEAAPEEAEEAEAEPVADEAHIQLTYQCGAETCNRLRQGCCNGHCVRLRQDTYCVPSGTEGSAE